MNLFTLMSSKDYLRFIAANIVLETADANMLREACKRDIAEGDPCEASLSIITDGASSYSELLTPFLKLLAVKEIALPTKCQAVLALITDCAEGVVYGVVTPRDGARKIWALTESCEELAPQFTIFEELDWALDENSRPKPFPELSPQQVQERIIAECKRIIEEKNK
jgi:hypothetical protein